MGLGEPHDAGEPAWTPPPGWSAMVQKVTVARLHKQAIALTLAADAVA